MTSMAGWGDVLAIAIQRSRVQGRLNGDQPLIRIDAQREAAQAPFQFDPVCGRLHRRDCHAIPSDARSALFGRWTMDAHDIVLACPLCCPAPQSTIPRGERIETVELLYGVASILGQFGTLLRERGKEFRNSDEGRQLEQQVESFYAQLDVQQRHVFDLLLTSLEQLAKAVQECDRNLQAANGTGGGPQSGANGRGMRREEQAAKSSVSRPPRAPRHEQTGARLNGRRQDRKRS